MFTGTVEATSHEGGLLVHFEGASPALNAIMVRAEDGIYIGKIDGVLGSTDHPLAHIAHVDRNLNIEDLVGIQVTIRPKQPRRDDNRRDDRRQGRDKDRRNDAWRDNQRQGRNQNWRNGGRRDDRRQHRSQDRRSSFQNAPHRNGDREYNDWTCPQCNNSNFARRNACNRCEAPRPNNGGGGRDNRRQNRGFDRRNDGRRNERQNNQGGFRDERRQGRGNDRRNDGRRNDRQNRGTFNCNDWTCSKCNNSNFSFRNVCNRCEAPRPGGGGGGSRNNEQRPRQQDRNRSQRRTSDSNYRRSRGKRQGHAHNQPPRDFREPRKFERKRDD